MFNLKKKTKMKRNIIERIGLDRIAHVGVGAAVCAFMTLAVLFSLPDGGVLYKCTRDSGQALTHDLAALVGLYVEVVPVGTGGGGDE